jgi:hypothetical protein
MGLRAPPQLLSQPTNSAGTQREDGAARGFQGNEQCDLLKQIAPCRSLDLAGAICLHRPVFVFLHAILTQNLFGISGKVYLLISLGTSQISP